MWDLYHQAVPIIFPYLMLLTAFLMSVEWWRRKGLMATICGTFGVICLFLGVGDLVGRPEFIWLASFF
ncbi:MAG: hypothetical protein WC050_01510 [Candidatus Paceibacterota bacterium]